MKGKELVVDSIDESQERVSSHSIVTLKISCYKSILATEKGALTPIDTTTST